MLDVQILDHGQSLSLLSAEKKLKFHAIWLRDNSPDPETRSIENGQRLISLNQIPLDISIIDACIENNFLKVTFNPEQKTVFYETLSDQTIFVKHVQTLKVPILYLYKIEHLLTLHNLTND